MIAVPTDEANRDEIPAYLLPLVGYKARKAAQLCAHFALQEGLAIDKLKLIKLIYLAERKCLEDWHRPMLFDELFSLPHGPICSSTLNGIDGRYPKSVWDEYIARHGNRVVPVKKFTREDFDEISDAEFDVIDVVWKQFGSLSASRLRNFTHDNCAEYTETSGRIPISYKEILEAIGMPLEDADAIERDISGLRREIGILKG